MMARGPRLEMSADEYRRVAAGMMTEKEWRRNVRELAVYHGWDVLLEIPDRAYQVLAEAGRRDRSLDPTLAILRSWPDLFIGNRATGQALFLELKTAKGRPTPGQLEKIATLHDCGFRGGIWRPGQRDVLEAVLMGERDE